MVREREVPGDFDDHTAEHEHEGQRKAETDVQGQDDDQNVQDDDQNVQDDDQNVQDDSGDYKYNDDQQDNGERE